MNPYNPDAPCPKCGAAADLVTAIFCTDNWLADHGSQHPHRGVVVEDPPTEHLDRTCTRCHFQWVEACVDAKEE